MSIKIHYFKIEPYEFGALLRNEKTHEIRKDDRPVRPMSGDVLILREYTDNSYTGRELRRVVTHVTSPGTWGLPADIYVMSVAQDTKAQKLSDQERRAAMREPTCGAPWRPGL